MSISLALAGQNLLSGIPPPCAWAAAEDSPPRIREDSRPFAVQIFRSPDSNSRFFSPSGDPRLGIDSNRESHQTKISFAKDMTRGERTCMDSR
jgi:hypothetical protein